MASQPLVALGIDNTMPDALGSYQQGVQANQTQQHDQIANATQTAELLGSGALYAMGGKLDGEVDPQKYNEVLDSFQNMGLDVGKYRGNPNFAKVFANASVSFLDRAKLAQNDRDFALEVKKFDWEIQHGADQLDIERQRVTQAGQRQFGNVLYGRDKDGNVVPLQATSSGDIVQPALPEGVTSVIPPDQMAGAKSYQGTLNKAAATAEGKLPQVEQAAATTHTQIESLKADPYLPDMLGPVNSRLPNVSGEAARVQSKIDQLNSESFLAAYNSLRGGGQISDAEGKKADKALLRAQTAQNIDDFKTALDEFDAIVQRGVETLRRQAAQGGGLTDQGAAPAGGGAEDPLGIR